jgi:hypothetical protein
MLPSVSKGNLEISEYAANLANPQRTGITVTDDFSRKVVGASGFEPPASWSRTRRASQAALRPEILKTTANSLSRITTHRNQSYCAKLPTQRATRSIIPADAFTSRLDSLGKVTPTHSSSCAAVL